MTRTGDAFLDARKHSLKERNDPERTADV